MPAIRTRNLRKDPPLIVRTCKTRNATFPYFLALCFIKFGYVFIHYNTCSPLAALQTHKQKLTNKKHIWTFIHYLYIGIVAHTNTNTNTNTHADTRVSTYK